MARVGLTAGDEPAMANSACLHRPPCPPFGAPDHDAARVIAAHPEQGWSLLCNGVVILDDTGEILPSGDTIAPHRPACRSALAGAL